MVTRDIERNIMDYLVESNLTKPHLQILTQPPVGLEGCVTTKCDTLKP